MSIAGTLQDSVNIRYVFTISGTPTTVNGADDNSNTLAYTAGQADVYLNGVKQVVGTDVTATSGSSVVFASALAAGDVVEVVAFDTFQAAAINADNITSGTLSEDRLENPGRRNIIINGDMRINQRGFASDVDNAYTVDRFVYQSSQGDKFTITQDTDTPSGEGFVNSLKFVTASAVSIGASDYFMITQAIEGYNAAVLNLGTSSARTFTLSFWTRSSLTGTFGGAIGNAGTRYYPFTYTIDSADTWERKTVTVAGDTTGTWATDASHGLIVRFGLGVGSTKSGTAGAWAAGEFFSATGATSVVGTGSATWYITGVQLEVGSTASDFEHIQYTEQLKLCERYFEVCGQGAFGVAENSTFIGITEKFKTLKRGIPTLSLKASQQCSFRHQASDKTITPSSLSATTPSYRGYWCYVNGFTGLTLQGVVNSRNNTASRGGFIFADAEL